MFDRYCNCNDYAVRLWRCCFCCCSRYCFLWYFVLSLLFCTVALAETNSTVRSVSVNGKRFISVAVNPKHLSLHWQSSKGIPYHHFSALKNDLKKQGKNVRVMMNAGIYGTDDKPAGLHIENGQPLKALNTHSGHGNFHLSPNGVFYLTRQGQPAIRTTTSFQKKYGKSPKTLQLATQSGPMLLINGRINPIFIRHSQSEYTRNGVCVSKDDTVYFFATDSGERSNFYTFAAVALQLGCRNALYLDGSISKLFITGHHSLFHFSHFVGILVESE